MEIARKITIAGINGVRGGFDVKPDAPVTLMARVMGLARKVEVKTTTYGDSLKFVGEFRAINADGEEFAAPVIYLPKPADEMLAEALTEAGENGVQFAFDIFIEPVPKKTPVDRGYQFKVKPLLDTKPSDPLAALMAGLPAPAVRAKQPALPGVDAASEKAPEPSEEKAPDVAQEAAPAPEAKGKGKGK
jgi:hypothetical protein